MSSCIDTDQYAIQQNNVGVNCYTAIGDIDAALNCFRQALAAKLATEQRMLPSTETSGVETLHNLDSHALEVPTVVAEELHQRCVTPEPTDFLISDQLEVNAPDTLGMYSKVFYFVVFQSDLILTIDITKCLACYRLYLETGLEFVPYLYTSPFIIKGACDARLNLPTRSTPDMKSTVTPSDAILASTESTTVSLMIIFNLALAHHTKDRASMKAYSIYQLAMTLLSALPPPTNSQSLLLHVAVLNNFGVWCFENHEHPSMVVCFEEMMHMLDETYTVDNDITITLSVGVKRGIFHNIQAALNDY